MRPRWAVLDLGHAQRVWPQARQAFLSQVVGPRFEQICRDWALLADDVLERARDLLMQRGFDTAAAKLACFSGSGFDDHLREAAANRADVLLVYPDQLYM